MSNENTIKRLANDCVRYIITQKSANDEITASDLQEKAIKDKSIRFSIVFKKVQTILLHVSITYMFRVRFFTGSDTALLKKKLLFIDIRIEIGEKNGYNAKICTD